MEISAGSVNLVQTRNYMLRTKANMLTDYGSRPTQAAGTEAAAVPAAVAASVPAEHTRNTMQSAMVAELKIVPGPPMTAVIMTVTVSKTAAVIAGATPAIAENTFVAARFW